MLKNIGQDSQNKMQRNSWVIINNTITLKKCALSFFHYHGSGIPKDTSFFWSAESLKLGEKKYIQLYFEEVKYEAYLIREANDDGRLRLFWHSDLSNKFKKLYPEYQMYSSEDYPLICFTPKKKDVYEIEFVSDNDEETNDNTDLETVIEVNGFTLDLSFTINHHLLKKSHIIKTLRFQM